MKSYHESIIREHYKKLTKYLIENRLSITTMESATSGQIASLITDTEGASSILKGAFITYSNEAKVLQGVPNDIIEKYSVYSKETAIAMAQAAANTYKANISIGITGTMGNIDPANPHTSSPGHVYFAILLNGTLFSYSIELEAQENRLMYKLAVAEEIYQALMELL